MKTKDIYFKTMKFVWLKLGLGLLTTLASVVLFAICAGIGALIGETGIMVMGIIWLILTTGLLSFIKHYVGYILKASHIAVITTAVTTGQVPDNMVEVGKDMVKERFVSSNVYFALNGLVSGAVRQLQKGVGAIDNLFGNIPGISTVVSFLQLFIGIALGYIDECCLGYTFLRKNEGAFKAGCDGVAIYFQNAKKLLKSAAVTALMVIGFTLLAMLVPLFIFVPICKALSVPTFFAVIVAFMLASVIRSSFIDSYILVKTMKSYMEVAPYTEVTFDIYGKLCKLSGKFKQLFNKAKNESPVMVGQMY